MADLSQTAASVLRVSGNVAHVTYGTTVVAGKIVVKMSDGKWDPAVVDGTASPTDYTTGVYGIGIALNGGGDGQPGTVQIDGEVNPGASAAEGIIYTCSAAAAGAIAPSADLVGADNDVVSVIGVGTSTGTIKLAFKASGENV